MGQLGASYAPHFTKFPALKRMELSLSFMCQDSGLCGRGCNYRRRLNTAGTVNKPPPGATQTAWLVYRYSHDEDGLTRDSCTVTVMTLLVPFSVFFSEHRWLSRQSELGFPSRAPLCGAYAVSSGAYSPESGARHMFRIRGALSPFILYAFMPLSSGTVLFLFGYYWGSSGSIVSDYWLDDRGSIPDRGRGFFL
jgi:hypothetical protein